MPLVLVRTPTYRRPDLLARAMRGLQAQTHEEWVCEVRDDCPDGSARAVVEDLGDPRIRHVQNRPQKFMVRNLDDCFLREHPHGADFFFMLEDDNQVRPEFIARGCEIIRQAGVTICQLNQVIEHDSRTPNARIGKEGIFDERVHAPEELHLGMFGAVGLSNGAVFWSKDIRRELAIRVETIPTLEAGCGASLISRPPSPPCSGRSGRERPSGCEGPSSQGTSCACRWIAGTRP